MAGSFPLVTPYHTDTRSSNDGYRFSVNSAVKSEGSQDSKHDITKESPLAPDERRPVSISKAHRKLVFTDPVAFRYLEEDVSTTVLARRHKLEGYELYIVEQWVVSRTHPTFTICTYTGDTSKSILVNVLAVPHDQSTWSNRLKVYFDAVSQSYAREKETSLGTLMVTNLSGFPSALNVIAVADGDVKKHREDFIVNENLKRMGCAGRAAMSLQYPQASTMNKFHHMYRTSEKVPLYSSVMELVRFCQLALVLYGKLDEIYADGLLCDITERAISEWWNEIGIDFHNVEPNDGILGPTTVSALLGLVIGAHNRLKETGAPVGKDPIDLPGMKRAIAHFQKANKMERSRRLDRATLDRLHRVTANKAEDEGLAVTRALKSTVAGLSGKGGEMIARGFGGGKEKAGIAEVETLDIGQLALLVAGRSMKWLWQGKDRGHSGAGVARPVDELNGRIFSTDDQGNFIWTSEDRVGTNEYDYIDPGEPEERDRRSGRRRDAAGLSNNKHQPHRSQHTDDEGAKRDHLLVPPTLTDARGGRRSQRSSRSTSREQFPALDLALDAESASKPNTDKPIEQERSPDAGRERSDTRLSTHRQALRGIDHRNRESPSKRKQRQELASIREALQQRRYRDFSATVKLQQPSAKALRRSYSAIQLRSIQEGRIARLPRHLSFSLISDSLEVTLDHGNDADGSAEDASLPARARMKIYKELQRQSQGLGTKFYALNRSLIPFATSRIERVEYIESDAQAQLADLNNAYYQHLEEYQTLQATSTELVAREKTSLNEAMRSIEMLGQKLDYELASLGSRMHEVEESVDDFERRVVDIEASVKTLIAEDEAEKRPPWYERWFPFSKRQSEESDKSPVQTSTS